jgi:hypothetical protein
MFIELGPIRKIGAIFVGSQFAASEFKLCEPAASPLMVIEAINSV